jgi:preprotein translocase subunit SecE
MEKTSEKFGKLFLAGMAVVAVVQLFFWFTARGTHIGLVALATLFAFAYLWVNGYLTRFANYLASTREELKKCTWPTWEELRGSTVVVMISILLLGVFTVGVDIVLLLAVKILAQ